MAKNRVPVGLQTYTEVDFDANTQSKNNLSSWLKIEFLWDYRLTKYTLAKQKFPTKFWTYDSIINHDRVKP